MTSHGHSQTLAGLHRRRQYRLHDLVALWRQRQVLRRLDDAALDDLGLSRRAALSEARRPFWDLPDHLLG